MTHYAMRDCTQARELFFGRGQLPRDLIDDAILASWVRCAEMNKQAEQAVVFDGHTDARTRDLLAANQALIEHFGAALRRFGPAFQQSGFHPVLTDAQSIIIASRPASSSDCDELQRALALGTDMSEQAIGTAAMNCALAVQRPVQVVGREHYFELNGNFQCAAAPVFGPEGRMLGAINLTKRIIGPEAGALSLAEGFASAIEHDMLARVPGACLLRVSWSRDDRHSHAVAAFGTDGQLLGMTQDARRFLNPFDAPIALLSFDRVFEQRFGIARDMMSHSRSAIPMRLRSGLLVYIENISVPRSAESASEPVSGRDGLQASGAAFGDGVFSAALPVAAKALRKGLAVLLRGETGVGKEVVATQLHAATCASAAPRVAINCAAIPETLIESELFGYAEGTYTGGRKGGSPGRIEEANGGTLFLDEIGDMPLPLQARLLRVLDSREVTRLGESKARRVSFNLICATHQDLAAMTAQGRFRADLYYRIAAYTLHIPPLRSRAQRAQLFDKLVLECGHAAGLSGDALDVLCRYAWPGNVREAINVLRRATLLCDESRPLGRQDTVSYTHLTLPTKRIV